MAVPPFLLFSADSFKPSRRVTPGNLFLLLHRVAAELIPHHGKKSIGKGFLIARTKPLKQRKRYDRRWNIHIYGLKSRPTSLAGILHVRFDAAQIRIFG
jgi:hypothetical protein